MTPKRLDGCYFKAQRASEHVQQLNAVRSECLTSKFLRAEIEADGIFHVARLRVVNPPPPRVANIVGDVVHNLRSVLDHLACAMVEASGGTVNRQTQFPVTENRETFDRVRLAQLPHVTPEMLALVERLQPYNRVPFGADPLHIISRLDMEDKHRSLLVAAVLPERVIVQSRAGREGIRNLQANQHLAFPMKVGDELVRFMLDSGLQINDIDVQVQLAADLALVEQPPVHAQPVVMLCHDLVEFIYRDVLLYASPLVASA